MSTFWKGMALPWKGTLASLVEAKDDSDILSSSVLWILLTHKGERVMLPEFGSDVPELVFEPNNDITVAAFDTAIRTSLERWDDRVELVDTTYVKKQNEMWCRLRWRAKKYGTLDVKTIEFPITEG